MNKDLAVNFFGFLGSQTGLGEAARNNIRALRGVECIVETFDVSDGENKECCQKNQINIFQINPDDLYTFFLRYGKEMMDNAYNIAFWAWETEDFPDHYQKYFDYFDEIWTPSSYCQKAISKKSPVPVLSMPHAIPLTPHSGQIDGLRVRTVGARKDSFLFSFFFDYKSQLARKNVLGLIDSFQLAFGKNNPDVTLLLKTCPSKHHQQDKMTVEEKIADDRSVVLFEEVLERDELQDLLHITDCYVSLHHAEGFGLTMAEAMALGKPVIATAYSGNMDFMNVNNALLVRYKLVSLTETIGPFVSGSRWAEPDIEHAAQLMQMVANGHSDLGPMKTSAKEQILTYHSLEYLGQLMKDRLSLISHYAERHKASRIDDEINRLNLENELLKTKVNKLREIKFVKLKLKFKNMQNRLLGKNKKYLWE